MNLFERIREAVRILTTGNRYEAAQPSSPNRAYLPAFVRDARFDANSFSRWEMSRKIRYFERNVWLVQRIRDEFSKWTVGPAGLQIIPSSSDEEWNAWMLEDYLRWCEAPCLDSTINMTQVHRQMANEFCIEGGVFVHETRRKLIGRPSEPAVQLIRGHRVSSPGVEYSSSFREQEDLVDGVQLGRDELGRVVAPVGYWVRDDFAGNEWVFRGTDVMQHVYDPEIPGMYREVTPWHAILNPLADVEELELLEMQRAKSNAEEAKIFKTISGEMPRGQFIRERVNAATGGGNAPSQDADLEKRLEMYRRILGSRAIAIRTNEEVITPQNPSPSASTQWHWQYKLGQICSAVGVPLILIFPELVGRDAQGTVVRGIYDNAHEFFRSKTHLFASVARRLYRFRANWARYNNPKLYDAPADWDACHVILPRAVNVDVGYTSEATLAELAAGVLSRDDVAGRMGTTARVQLRKCANDVADLKLICQEVSKARKVEVKPEEVSAPLADVVATLAKAKAAAQQPAKQKPEEVAA